VLVCDLVLGEWNFSLTSAFSSTVHRKPSTLHRVPVSYHLAGWQKENNQKNRKAVEIV